MHDNELHQIPYHVFIIIVFIIKLKNEQINK